MSFLDHLADLRRALIRAGAAYLVALAIAFPLAPALFTWLKRPLAEAGKDPDTFLVVFEVAGGLSVAMSAGLWGAFVLALPFIVLAAAGFIFPGLTPREKRLATIGLGAATLLFAAGVAAGYFLMLPAALRVMLWFNDWMGIPVPFFFAADYVRFVLLILASFGLAFELPLGVMILGYLGILSSGQLRDKRRHALVFIMILAAVITPTTDPFSLFFMAVPLAALYELAIWTTWFAERRRARADAAD